MDNFLTVVNGMALLLGGLGAAVAVFYVAYSRFLFITDEGDPRRLAQARSSLIGVAVGVVVIGGSFIIPGTISRLVVEPAGGVAFDPVLEVNCDAQLKRQLVVQRTASTPERMQFLVSQVQAKRDGCAADLWNPEVKPDAGYPSDDCPAIRNVDGVDVHEVGGVPVPKGLKNGASVNNLSSRDSDNNIIVFWDDPNGSDLSRLPSDGAACWLYVAAFDAWSQSYYHK